VSGAEILRPERELKGWYMVRRIFALAALLLVSMTLPPGDDAGGRPGSLVLVGGGAVGADVKHRFLDLAGGPRARIVTIPSASNMPDAVADARAFWEEEGVQVTVLHTTSRDEADSPEFYRPLRSATGVWIGGGDQTRFMAIYGGTGVERELISLYRRGRVIGGTSAGASLASRIMIYGDGETRGLGLLNRVVVDQHFNTRARLPRLLNVLDKHPDHVGLGLDEGTGVVIRSENLTVVGASTVSVCRTGSGPQVLHRGDQVCLSR
jgi:cyanophycinase